VPIKPVTLEPEHRIMWTDGPTRRFSEVRTTLALVSYDLGGFVATTSRILEAVIEPSHLFSRSLLRQQ
jgi:hypothetical protein